MYARIDAICIQEKPWSQCPEVPKHVQVEITYSWYISVYLNVISRPCHSGQFCHLNLWSYPTSPSNFSFQRFAWHPTDVLDASPTCPKHQDLGLHLALRSWIWAHQTQRSGSMLGVSMLGAGRRVEKIMPPQNLWEQVWSSYSSSISICCFGVSLIWKGFNYLYHL